MKEPLDIVLMVIVLIGLAVLGKMLSEGGSKGVFYAIYIATLVSLSTAAGYTYARGDSWSTLLYALIIVGSLMVLQRYVTGVPLIDKKKRK